MTWHEIDHIFPYLVFIYGIMMLIVLENKYLDRLASERMPAMLATMKSHKQLAYTCLWVGGLWSLQNLWYSSL